MNQESELNTSEVKQALELRIAVPHVIVIAAGQTVPDRGHWPSPRRPDIP